MAVKIDVDVIKPGTPSAADQRRRKVVYFAIANLVALAIAAGIFALLAYIPEGRGFDGAMAKVSRFFGSHMGVAALAASTPFFASLLVGQYEMRRARARRARKEAEEKRREHQEQLLLEEAARAARRAVKH
jgi:hypothetical protein